MKHPHDPIAIFEAAGGMICHNSANVTPMRDCDYSALTNFEGGKYTDECDLHLAMAATPEKAALLGMEALPDVDFIERRWK